MLPSAWYLEGDSHGGLPPVAYSSSASRSGRRWREAGFAFGSACRLPLESSRYGRVGGSAKGVTRTESDGVLSFSLSSTAVTR